MELIVEEAYIPDGINVNIEKSCESVVERTVARNGSVCIVSSVLMIVEDQQKKALAMRFRPTCPSLYSCAADGSEVPGERSAACPPVVQAPKVGTPSYPTQIKVLAGFIHRQ